MKNVRTAGQTIIVNKNQSNTDPKKRDQLKIENRQKGSGQKRNSTGRTSPLARSALIASRRNSGDKTSSRKANAQMRSFNQTNLMEHVQLNGQPRGMKRSSTMKKLNNSTVKLLPSDFQQNVIVQEFKIETGNVDITEIITMYQSAVEHYDSVGDVKNSELYKQKMTLIFMKPHISKLFNPTKTIEKSPKRRSPKMKKSPKRISPPRQSPQNAISIASNEQSDKQLTLNIDQPAKVSEKESEPEVQIEDVNLKIKPEKKVEVEDAAKQGEAEVKPEVTKEAEKPPKADPNRRRSLNQRRRSSRPRSSELIKILKEIAPPEEPYNIQEVAQEAGVALTVPAAEPEFVELPEYSYRQLPPLNVPIQRQESFTKEQNLIQQLEEIKKNQEENTEYKEKEKKVIEGQLGKMQRRKKEISTLVKKDLRDQSEEIQKRLAMRSKRRQSSSMQKLNLSSINLKNQLTNQTSISTMGGQESDQGARTKKSKRSDAGAGNNNLVQSRYIPANEPSGEKNKFINLDNVDVARLIAGGRNQISPKASAGTNSFNLQNMSNEIKNKTTQKSQKTPIPSSAMKDTINFSDLLDDVTFIPDINDSSNKKKKQLDDYSSSVMVNMSSNENLRKASYLTTHDKQISQNAKSTSNSFDIIDAESKEPSTPDKKIGISSGSEPNRIDSNISDRIKSIISEAPATNLVSPMNSASFSISQTSSRSNIHQKEENEEQKQANAEIQKKVQFELEKSMIDMKYKQQMTALEKKGKPNNPLTKRLMQKVQTEWDKAVEKKKQDFGIADDVNEVEVLVK